MFFGFIHYNVIYKLLLIKIIPFMGISSQSIPHYKLHSNYFSHFFGWVSCDDFEIAQCLLLVASGQCRYKITFRNQQQNLKRVSCKSWAWIPPCQNVMLYSPIISPIKKRWLKIIRTNWVIWWNERFCYRNNRKLDKMPKKNLFIQQKSRVEVQTLFFSFFISIAKLFAKLGRYYV